MKPIILFNQEQSAFVKSLEGSKFQSLCKQSVKIISAGVFCQEIGLHMHAECVKQDSMLLTGDIITTQSLRDWYDYKAHLNSRYNRVILHITFDNNLFNLLARLQNGKRILTVIGDEEVADSC